jgi:hypothetical protein
MPVPTLSVDDKPDDVLMEHVHCRTTLQADPLSAALATPFDGLINDWKQAHIARLDLEVELYQAVAIAYYVDTKLDAIVDRLVPALTKITQGDRTVAEWVVFFQGADPYSFKKPILASQLGRMDLWLPSLTTSSNPELVNIGAALAPLVASGKAAQTAIDAARQALIAFDNVGPWRQHIDKSNAARASAYGTLLQIPHQNPALQLPADYQEKFFLHDTSRRGAGKPETSADIKAEMDANNAKNARLAIRFKETEEREKAEEAALVARQSKQAELAALKQQEKEAKQKRKALQKDLGKKK